MVQSRACVGVERNTTYLNPAGRSERWSTFEGNRPNQYTVKPEVGSVMVTSPEGFLWYSSARIDRHQQYFLVATLTTTTYEESSKPVSRHVKRVVSKPLLATDNDRATTHTLVIRNIRSSAVTTSKHIIRQILVNSARASKTMNVSGDLTRADNRIQTSLVQRWVAAVVSWLMQ